MNFDDPNDPRNYPIRNPLLPPINIGSRHNDDAPLIYHDFDYVGYDRVRKRTPDLPKKKQTVRSAVEPKSKKMSQYGYSPKYPNF